MTAVRAAFERDCLPMFASRFRPGDLVLNLGAGRHAYREAFPCRVVTADPDPGCDDQFKAETIPYPDASVDGVLLMGVFERLDDPMQALREIFRVLRPGGLLLISLLDLGVPWRKAVDRWRVSATGALHVVRDFILLDLYTVADQAQFVLVRKPTGGPS